MLGLILGGLGSAATAAGMGTLGAGLTAAGTAIGGVPGLGGSGLPGIGGVGLGAGAPGSMPFGFDITKMINPASENLGTSAGGWSTSVTPAPSGLQELAFGKDGSGGLMQQSQKQNEAMIAKGMQSVAPSAVAQPQGQIDIEQLLSIINNRSRLGS